MAFAFAAGATEAFHAFEFSGEFARDSAFMPYGRLNEYGVHGLCFCEEIIYCQNKFFFLCIVHTLFQRVHAGAHVGIKAFSEADGAESAYPDI